MGEFLSRMKRPNQEACEAARANEPALQRRHWKNIKYKVHNLILKSEQKGGRISKKEGGRNRRKKGRRNSKKKDGRWIKQKGMQLTQCVVVCIRLSY